ncbi:hypothetical protein L596_005376 [Steinernema carpocapsae]|uniref:Uncharacterized protein n=1 Tax=Steinernema carpocapsae TaxID=34508 RepID=A0A4U8V098_STECR|nr:hypothetical protein L596_005376 [Steinernema carpocapsae]
MNLKTPATSPDTTTFRRRVMTACSYRSPSTTSPLPRSRIPQLMTRSAMATPSRKGSFVSDRMIRSMSGRSASPRLHDGSCEQLAEQTDSPLRQSQVLLLRIQNRDPSPVVSTYNSPALTFALNRVMFERREYEPCSLSSSEEENFSDSDSEADRTGDWATERKFPWTRNAFGGRGKPTAEEAMHVRSSHLAYCHNCRYDQLLLLPLKRTKSLIRSRCICFRMQPQSKVITPDPERTLLDYAALCALFSFLLELLFLLFLS